MHSLYSLRCHSEASIREVAAHKKLQVGPPSGRRVTGKASAASEADRVGEETGSHRSTLGGKAGWPAEVKPVAKARAGTWAVRGKELAIRCSRHGHGVEYTWEGVEQRWDWGSPGEACRKPSSSVLPLSLLL